MRLISIRLAILILITGNASSAIAASHPLHDIRDAAVQYVRSHFSSSAEDIKIVAQKLDARLLLPQCKSPLEAYLPHGSRVNGNTTVGVRCHGNKPWSVFVPVNVQIYRDIVVASRSLAKNKILKAEDFHTERFDINRFSGAYLTELDKIIGKQLIRPVQLGTPVLSNMLKKPILIRRGELVILLAKTHTYEVRMQGKAMMDGASGDRIRVRNSSSKRIIEGKLAEDGTVLVY